MRSVEGRWVLVTTILGSSMVLLTATVVNVALPTIGREFGAGAAGLQWVVNGYLLTLAALILTGGALGDRLGRRRVYLAGVVVFAVASMACAIAPTLETLVAARIVQGMGGALLTPGSLAIINSTIRLGDRGRAVGTWAGLTGVATAVGPVLGGWLIDAVDWRAIFLLNVPVAAAVFVVAMLRLPRSGREERGRPVDVCGAFLATASLGAITFAVIQAPELGFGDPLILTAAACGGAGAAGFFLVELHRPHPMMPLGVFRIRSFTAANIVTAAVYGPLSGMFFLVTVYLQNALGYSPLEAGAASLPVTVLMVALSPAAGELAHRIGPRALLTAGPLVIATSLVLMAGIAPGDPYFPDVALAMGIFGLGLASSVSPVTSSALAALEDSRSGLASGINNSVARTSQLLAVASLPPLAGLTGDAFIDVPRFVDRFPVAMFIAAGVAVLGGIAGFTGMRGNVLDAEA